MESAEKKIPPRKRQFRSRNSQETKKAILCAAEKIFAEAGPAGARMDAIARSAGINKAMLHYYFKNKRGLYQAVLESNIEQFHRQASVILEGEGSAREVVLQYVAHQFDFIGARPYYPRLFQNLVMAGDPAMARILNTYLAPLFRKLAGVIEDGVRSGEFHPLDARHTVQSLIALIVFYFSAARVARQIGNVDVFAPAQQLRRKEEVLKFVRYALFRNPEDAA
jgi:TetR/AcrR family transcriptional regulator